MQTAHDQTIDDRVPVGPGAEGRRILELETANRTLVARLAELEARALRAEQPNTAAHFAQLMRAKVGQASAVINSMHHYMIDGAPEGDLAEVHRAVDYFVTVDTFDPGFLPWPRD